MIEGIGHNSAAFGVTPLADTPHAGAYNVVFADPAWRHVTRSAKGVTARSPGAKYPTMSIQEICDLPVSTTAGKNCHLFLWTTGVHLELAFRVIHGWGFKYSGMGFVWIKQQRNVDPNQLRLVQTIGDELFVGTGYTTRKNAEFCLLGRRGSPKRLARDVREVIVAPRREHSRKPDEAYRRVLRYADGPRLEMFSRENREGYDAWGNETGKFDGR